jgi:hypothetical protein
VPSRAKKDAGFSPWGVPAFQHEIVSEKKQSATDPMSSGHYGSAATTKPKLNEKSIETYLHYF